MIVKNLGFNGDPIYAGMTEWTLLGGIPTLATDIFTPGKGHFYYAPDTLDGKNRRKSLAEDLYRSGLR